MYGAFDVYPMIAVNGICETEVEGHLLLVNYGSGWESNGRDSFYSFPGHCITLGTAKGKFHGYYYRSYAC